MEIIQVKSMLKFGYSRNSN